MLKFFRKYNKFILVVFGSLLMVAFLVPTAIQRIGQNPKGRVVARLGDKVIRSLDYQFAQQELRALGNLAPQLVGPGGILGLGDERNDDAHWILLTKAAEDAGMIGEVGDGESWIGGLTDQLAVLYAANALSTDVGRAQQFLFQNPLIAQTFFNQAQKAAITAPAQGSLTEPQFHTALAKARGVFRLIVAHNRMARLSLQRSENESKSIGDQAIADALFLHSSLVESEIDEPTEEELLSHFERFRETRAFEGDFGIGYLMPARVKIEVLKLDRQAIADAATLDPVAVSRRWQRNKDQFGEDREIAKPLVETQLRNEFADDILRKADRHIKAFTFRARDQLKLDGDYYVIPENWDETRPTLEQAANYVIEQIEKDIHADGNDDFVMPRPVVTVLAANWYTFSDLQAEESIRGAAVTIANQRVSISQLVFGVHEFEPTNELGFQVGLPAVSFVASDNFSNHYFFTVLAAQDESPAASLDEVQEKVTTDFISLAAYELLVSRLDEYKQLAISGGLQAVSDLFATEAESDPLATNIAGTDPEAEDLNTTEKAGAKPGPAIQENLRVGDPAIVPGLPGEANDQLFRDAILQAASSIDPLTLADDIDPASATIAVALPARLGIELGRVRLPRPLTIELYRVHQFRWGQVLIGTELRDAMLETSNPYSYENLAARYNWTFVNERDTVEVNAPSPSETPPDETDPAADGEG